MKQLTQFSENVVVLCLAANQVLRVQNCLFERSAPPDCRTVSSKDLRLHLQIYGQLAAKITTC